MRVIALAWRSLSPDLPSLQSSDGTTTIRLGCPTTPAKSLVIPQAARRRTKSAIFDSCRARDRTGLCRLVGLVDPPRKGVPEAVRAAMKRVSA